MKIKDGYLLRQVAGQTVVLAMGEDMDLNTMITLNETGAFLWEHLQEEADVDQLVSALLKEYDVDETTARACVIDFVGKLEKHGFLAE